MTIENKQHRYVTYDEFNRFIIANDQKFENLTEIMLSQFDKVYVKFNEIDTKFDDIDAKFDKVYTKFDEIGVKFDNVYSEFAKINERIDTLQSKMVTIESMLHSIINHLGIKTA